MNTLISTSVDYLFKSALLPFAPLQAKLDPPSPVHGWILDQALRTLCKDGYKEVSLFFSSFSGALYRGLIWADKGWKNYAHYCQAEHKYLPGASALAEGYYHKALQSFNNNIENTFFYLGATLHIIQDMAVPHHAAGVLRDGHQHFERWVLRHWNEHASITHGCYRAYQRPSAWIRHSVDLSKPYLPLVSFSHGATKKTYADAADFLVPLSIRVSAGFLTMAHSDLYDTTSSTSCSYRTLPAS